MTKDKTLELLEDLWELFHYGYPVYPDTLLDNEPETFMERVEELLSQYKKENA